MISAATQTVATYGLLDVNALID